MCPDRPLSEVPALIVGISDNDVPRYTKLLTVCPPDADRPLADNDDE